MSETAAIGFVGGRQTRESYAVGRNGRTRREGPRGKVWQCTAMFPLPPGYLYQSEHPEAREISWYDDGEDCIGRYRCPHCGNEFRAVIPR